MAAVFVGNGGAIFEGGLRPRSASYCGIYPRLTLRGQRCCARSFGDNGIMGYTAYRLGRTGHGNFTPGRTRGARSANNLGHYGRDPRSRNTVLLRSSVVSFSAPAIRRNRSSRHICWNPSVCHGTKGILLGSTSRIKEKPICRIDRCRIGLASHVCRRAKGKGQDGTSE